MFRLAGPGSVGIFGKYELTLNWTPDEAQFTGKAPQPADDPLSPGFSL